MADQPAVSHRDTIQVVTQAFNDTLPDRDFITDDEFADAFSAAVAAFESHTGRKLPAHQGSHHNMPQDTPKPWWDQHDCLKLRLEPGETKRSLFDHDTVITKTIAGEEMYAMVPTWVLPPLRNYVPVQYAGNTADKVLIYFPVGNEGRASWFIPNDQYRQLVSREPI